MAVQDKRKVFNYRFACAMCMPLCGVTSQLQELKKKINIMKKSIYVKIYIEIDVFKSNVFPFFFYF